MDFGKLRLVFGLMAFTGMISAVLAADSTPAGGITSALCSIVSAVQTIVGILALTLFIIGGVLYAVSHFLPTNMEFKKSITAWSQGMIVGGIIGLIIVLIAGPVVTLIFNVGNSANSTPLTLSTC